MTQQSSIGSTVLDGRGDCVRSLYKILLLMLSRYNVVYVDDNDSHASQSAPTTPRDGESSPRRTGSQPYDGGDTDTPPSKGHLEVKLDKRFAERIIRTIFGNPKSGEKKTTSPPAPQQASN